MKIKEKVPGREVPGREVPGREADKEERQMTKVEEAQVLLRAGTRSMTALHPVTGFVG